TPMEAHLARRPLMRPYFDHVSEGSPSPFGPMRPWVRRGPVAPERVQPTEPPLQEQVHGGGTDDGAGRAALSSFHVTDTRPGAGLGNAPSRSLYLAQGPASQRGDLRVQRVAQKRHGRGPEA